MSILTQNWDYLPWFSWSKPHMVLKLRKSRIQCFKWITIWSWNKGDMVNWCMATQKTCYEIAYGSNSFLLFGLNIRPLLGLFFFFFFFMAIGSFRVFQFLLTRIFYYRAILVIWILSIFNYQICNRIPKGDRKYSFLLFSYFYYMLS